MKPSSNLYFTETNTSSNINIKWEYLHLFTMGINSPAIRTVWQTPRLRIVYLKFKKHAISRSLPHYHYFDCEHPSRRSFDLKFLSYHKCYIKLSHDINISFKCSKAVPLQAWSSPECSKKLRFPDFMTTTQDGGKVVSSKHWPYLPPRNSPGTHFC
jgi:hypothetical protein